MFEPHAARVFSTCHAKLARLRVLLILRMLPLGLTFDVGGPLPKSVGLMVTELRAVPSPGQLFRGINTPSGIPTLRKMVSTSSLPPRADPSTSIVREALARDTDTFRTFGERDIDP
jgi:hypothetical protein